MRAFHLLTGTLLAHLAITRIAAAQAVAESAPPTPATSPGAESNAPPGNADCVAPRPRVLPYEPWARPPPGYHLDERPRAELIWAGVIAFGIPYIASLGFGIASRYEPDRWLLLPIAGPAARLTYMGDCKIDCSRHAGDEALALGALLVDLAAQGTGALLFIAGFKSTRKQWVSDHDVSLRLAPSVTWSVAPRIDGAGRLGFTFAGTIF